MNNFRKNLQHILPPVAILLLLFYASAITAAAQDSAAAGNANQSAAADTAAPPTPTPIPISDVVAQSEAVQQKLQEIETEKPENPIVQVIEDELPELKKQINARFSETTRLLTARPSLETLRQTEQDWESLTEKIPAWKNDLKAQIGVLDKQIEDLRRSSELWQKTLDALKNSPSSAAGSATAASAKDNAAPAADLSEAPPEVLQRISEVIVDIKKTQKQLEEKRARLLTLQTRVSEQENRVNDALAAIKQVREEALTHLFVKDSPAIWSVQRRADSAESLVQETESTFTAQITALSAYAGRQSERFILHIIVFLIFVGALFWARRKMRPLVEKEPELEQAVTIFKLPFATALILAVLVSGWFYPQSPRILTAMLGAAALIPVVVLLRRLLEKPLFPVLSALVIFYFVDQLRAVTAALPLVSRILFLTEMFCAIVFLVWFFRSKRLASKVEAGEFRVFAFVKKAVPFALLIFATAFLANVFGYVSLANVIGNGVLGSAYIALILYTVVQIAESLLIFAFRIRPLSALQMVKVHRLLIRSKSFTILKWLAIAAWVILTLNLLSIRETIFSYITDVFGAELAVGSLNISLGDVLLFAFTIWLSFLLSRFIRFVLEEDVYPRVELAGGVPYAISTMLHYVLLVVGFLLAIAALGVDLTKFTILAGALGVGLGFGLQNIVNNFVSGLILLFERPVKVGDTVQLGEHQGDLNRIGLRASVVRKVDGSDVIVPNSQLISEEVINWTLSDQQRRLDINVGVAYGTDPEMIIEMLSKVAVAHENVLKSPPPRTIFVGFGDNSLDFQLRAWTSHTENWVGIRSELAVGVHNALRDAKIEIPFPQRDMNLRTVSREAADIIRSKPTEQDILSGNVEEGEK